MESTNDITMEDFFKENDQSSIFQSIQNNDTMNYEQKKNHAMMLRMCIELLGFGRILSKNEEYIYSKIINEQYDREEHWTILTLVYDNACTQCGQTAYSELYYDKLDIQNNYYSYFEKYFENYLKNNFL